MIKKSFTLRVVVINFLLLALPLLIDSFIFFQNSYNDSIQSAQKQLREAANLRTYSLVAAEPVKQVLLSELKYVLNISDKMESQDYETLTHEFAEIAHAWGEYQLIALSLSNNGYYKIVAASERIVVDTFLQSYQQFETITREGSGTFIRYMYEQTAQAYVPYLFMAQTIHSKKTGAPVGILMVTANIQSQLNDIIIADPQAQNAQFAILNADSVVFKSSDPNLMGQHFNPISPVRRSQIIASMQLGNLQLPDIPLPVIRGDNPPFFEFIFKNQVQLAYQVFISDLNLSVVAYSPKEEFFGTAIRHFLLIYMIYGLILVGGGGVTYWLSLWISRPLRQLTHIMGEVSQGKLDVRFHEAPLGFEINILGRIFNNTLDTLLLNIQRAEDERVKKETYQRELAIGRQVQRSLLPSRVPIIKGAAVAGTYLPASEVGGDFYAFLSKTTESGEEVLALAVADVAGRGISSCLYSLSVRSLFRAYATLHDDVGEILSLTNNAFNRDTGDTGMFATMFLGFYHTQSRILSYYSCGHVPGIVRRSDGQIITLSHSGMALGLKESERFKPESIQLYSGDALFVYTDGLLESTNSQHQIFSEKRLKDVLQTKIWNTAQDAVNSLAASVQEFTAGIPQEEEVIIVALQVD
ncbi:PP2C family protein-serine/threonine phosphatase [Chlamydiota bacterium]